MAAIYCFGDGQHGELGLDELEDGFVYAPQKILWGLGDAIKQIASGKKHTIFLTTNGKVYSCGSNDNGQLGHLKPAKMPQIILELENFAVTQVSVGNRHTIALTEWGQVYAWGDNDLGQLGLGPTFKENTARIIRTLVSKQVVQIASGADHTLALTSSGELYAWGSNANGQLGLGLPNTIIMSRYPQVVDSLKGLPIALIACGAYHSFAISKSGAVFGWGSNSSGQLGLNDVTTRYYPTQLKTLRSLGVRFIACGKEFSVFLTKEGGVFTCGLGTHGQLGHGSTSNEVLPRKVMELMGSTVTQVACGSNHTLAFVPSNVSSSGRLYGFGSGSQGQLGIVPSPSGFTTPQVIAGPWVPSTNHVDRTEDENLVIKQIFAGADRTLVTTTYSTDQVPEADYRVYDPKTQILELTADLARQCSQKHDILHGDLLNHVEDIFKSEACLNGSFLMKDDKHLCCMSKNHGIDIKEATYTFDFIRKIENCNLLQVIQDKMLLELIPTLSPSPPDVENLRIYLIVPLYHEFVNAKNYEKLHTPFSKTVAALKEVPKKIVYRWWSEMPLEWFENMVNCYKHVVEHIIRFNTPSSEDGSITKLVSFNTHHLHMALEFLVALEEINHKARREKLHYEAFYWTELAEYVDIKQDYIQWIFNKKSSEAFNICNYPFLFNAVAKTALLQTDQALQMHQAMQSAASESLLASMVFGRSVSQFVVLNVSRENIVADTLREIMQLSASELKKPLKVKFTGEEAEDAGGVRKEFFMLLLRDILDPKYGMFKSWEETNYLWFSDTTFETDNMFTLVGVLCGLAIYNFTIINVPFPLALYKKLLDEPTDLSDLKDLTPCVANSFQTILDHTGDDFCDLYGDQAFEITVNYFGETKTVPLKENGENIKLTQENKKEFVELYTDYVLNKSVEKQFKAFRNGFVKVCWGRVLEIFKPQELMAMVVGNEEYDWKMLELKCEYKNGYRATDETIKMFWEVFHELPEKCKKKFLLYLTGSDRIPIQGMKEIVIYIQPTQDDRFLPVAHTCFNLLDLPRYKTKERLKYKLLQALDYPEGFHLV